MYVSTHPPHADQEAVSTEFCKITQIRKVTLKPRLRVQTRTIPHIM